MNHRVFIEQNNLGFGDRAFHYMWQLLVEFLVKQKDKPSLLEIGVYKGQVISLWRLLSKHYNKEVSISCITPMSGNVTPASTLEYYWKYLTSVRFRRDSKAGNFYKNENYHEIIRKLFSHFQLDFSEVVIYKGYSTDEIILDKLLDATFDLVYVDGDHSQHAAEADIRNFSSKINSGGFLVMDDASCNIPGGEADRYWKGHQSVSDACEIIPKLGFINVLNIGHNRIYQKK